ncbi:glycerol-3-phosphate 1-O-acyltransferase PlsY [Algicola sagamiensis]|uniref:glycerol-3-phosphate 1-O-acyltransferase PlsY n=1 Tax=Algicola sagamiensis TaxID=163869 RepID=UPI00035CD44F|nr:glycerol-3-phosphate 1-O-acyltransferase PlsY [Algicola sagamiensis]
MFLSLIMIVLAYLCGSLCSAVIVCRAFGHPDPRTDGSNNPGTTNVLRIAGKGPAALVLLGDVLKGTIPVWLAYFFKLEPIALGFVALAACIGHIFPCFFGFKGGKAVATALGAMFPIGWSLACLLLVTWLFVALITGYSSLAAVVTFALAPVYTFFIKPMYTIPVLMLAVLIIARHKENIARLYLGKESKIWDKGKKLKE